MNAIGAAEVQEFHRQLFANSFASLREEIKRITGVEVREATAEAEPETGTVVKAFTTGTVVQVFLLAGSVPTDTWTGSEPDHIAMNITPDESAPTSDPPTLPHTTIGPHRR